MKRHRRTITRVCVFLLLGAAVNVAVAWGIAVLTPTTKPIACIYPSSRASRHLTDRFAISQSKQCVESPYAGLNRSRVYFADALEPWFVDHEMVSDQLGFPLRSMQGEWARGMQHVELHGAIAMPAFMTAQSPPASENDIRLLPLAVIWPDFAINTLFYAGVCWLLFYAPFEVRRRLRVRRGQCANCAYPVGTSDLCTECGTPRPVTATTRKSCRALGAS